MRRLLLSLALCASAFGAKLTTLTIEVKSASGKPVDNAAVVVKFVKGRDPLKLGKNIRLTWEVRTNQEGSVKIPPIPQGNIQIQVIAKNYQTFGQTIRVDEEEKTVDVRLNAPQPQYSAH